MIVKAPEDSVGFGDSFIESDYVVSYIEEDVKQEPKDTDNEV